VVCSRFVDKGKFQGFVEVWFFGFFYYWRTRLSSDFGVIVTVGRASFFLIISEIDKVREQKFYVSCLLMIHL
jgi:hypothetical protein